MAIDDVHEFNHGVGVNMVTASPFADEDIQGRRYIGWCGLVGGFLYWLGCSGALLGFFSISLLFSDQATLFCGLVFGNADVDQVKEVVAFFRDD